MSASSPSAFLRPTNAKTHICEHTCWRFQNNKQQQSPRDRKEEKERKRKNQFSLLFTCLLSNNLLIKLARTRTKFHRRLYRLVRSRKGSRAVGGEWSHRFKIPEPAPKIFACARRRYALHSYPRAKENTNQLCSLLFLFLSSSSTSVMHHRVSRVVHSSSLIIKSLLRKHIERERLEGRKRRRRTSGSFARVRERETQKKKRSHLSHLFFSTRTPPRKKKIKENWRSLSLSLRILHFFVSLSLLIE